MGLKVTANELQLTLDLLKIEGTTKKVTFLYHFVLHGIHTLILDSLPTLTQENLLLAFDILTILSLNP